MPKGVPRKQYTGEFKQKAVEDMQENGLNQYEVAVKYEISRSMIQRWEGIYLEQGPEGLYTNRRGQASTASDVPRGQKLKLEPKAEENLIVENQRLRAEVAYLKKLNALVLEEERQKKRRK